MLDVLGLSLALTVLTKAAATLCVFHRRKENGYEVENHTSVPIIISPPEQSLSTCTYLARKQA
jgi:hypothetical protein